LKNKKQERLTYESDGKMGEQKNKKNDKKDFKDFFNTTQSSE
jgi:hypothetical protein